MCIDYFEEPDEKRRRCLRFNIPIKPMMRTFLLCLGYIEYELVTTFDYECHSIHKSINC